MAEKLTFGDGASIAVRNAADAATKPIDYMHALYGKKLSQACAGCKWFVTKLAYGQTVHDCSMFRPANAWFANWKANWTACGAHERMDVGKFR